MFKGHTYTLKKGDTYSLSPLTTTQYEPIFTPGNQQYVHHIIVYECTDIEEGLESEFEQLAADQGHGCTETIMLKYIRTCNHVVVAWAVGSEVST